MPTKPIPEGYHTITAQLAIDGAAKAIEFYKKAFSAEQVDRANDPSGQKVMHAALRVGDSMLFVNDIFPDMGGTASHSNMWLYVKDVDASFKQAIEAGGKPTMPPADMFWGDRIGQLADPFGQKWTLATRIKNLTPDELKKAEEGFFAQMKSGKKP